MLLTACAQVSTVTGQTSVAATEQATPSPPTPLVPSPTPEPVFSGERALELVAMQMDFGPRPTGSEAIGALGDAILTHLRDAGWETSEQPFEVQGVQARNLVGASGADGPVIILGAHYDTRMQADQDQTSPEAPVPGANDGASGVAVLLELARVLDVSRVDGQVWLVFFDAEDNGRLGEWQWIMGSQYFADHLSVVPAYVIVADMVGDADQGIYFEGNSDPVLRDHLWGVAAQLGYQDAFIPEIRHTMVDDHLPFAQRGIPAVDLIDFDYPYWHTTQDTIDKVSAASLERVGRVLEVFLESGGRYPAASAP
jgi:hypothetical protein